jgi:hypothetical protein
VFEAFKESITGPSELSGVEVVRHEASSRSIDPEKTVKCSLSSSHS